jgi:hypothetical protein
MAKPNTANLSAEELLAAVGQLSPPELDRFMLQVIALSARLKAGSLPRDEATLLHRINSWIPSGLQEQYASLIEKRQAEQLTEDEHAELLALTDRVEQLQVERLKSMTELARLRQVSLDELMEELGLARPSGG